MVQKIHCMLSNIKIKNIFLVNLTEIYYYSLLFCCVFIPYVDKLRPFHISFIFLFLLFPIIISKSYISFLKLIILCCVICLIGIIYGLLNNQYLNDSIYKSILPIVFLFVSFMSTRILCVSQRKFYFILIIISIILCISIFLQVFLPNFVLTKILYIGSSSDRVTNLARYIMILYPMQNPNNAGFVFAIFGITCQLLYPNVKNYKCLLIIILLVFFYGIIFSFARTVLVSFLIAELIILSFSLKKLHFIIFLTVVFAIFLYIINTFNVERYLTYYSTVFNALEDDSFTARYKFWNQYWILIHNIPFVILSGYPIYKDFFKIHYNSTVVDSSYLFLLLNYGVLSIIYVITWLIKNMIKTPKIILPLTAFLLINSITLPFISDIRIITLIGMIFGVLLQENKT